MNSSIERIFVFRRDRYRLGRRTCKVASLRARTVRRAGKRRMKSTKLLPSLLISLRRRRLLGSRFGIGGNQFDNGSRHR